MIVGADFLSVPDYRDAAASTPDPVYRSAFRFNELRYLQYTSMHFICQGCQWCKCTWHVSEYIYSSIVQYKFTVEYFTFYSNTFLSFNYFSDYNYSYVFILSFENLVEYLHSGDS